MGTFRRSGVRLAKPDIVGLASPECLLQANETYKHSHCLQADQSHQSKTRVFGRFKRGIVVLILTWPEAECTALAALTVGVGESGIQ